MFSDNSSAFRDKLPIEISGALPGFKERTGARFNAPGRPLLVYVRFGAKISMPGMIDTLLNLGLDEIILISGPSQKPNGMFAPARRRELFWLFDSGQLAFASAEAAWKVAPSAPEMLARSLNASVELKKPDLPQMQRNRMKNALALYCTWC